MLNFKFLKWATLCGLLVFALDGCAKDEPCGGSSIATDTRIYQSISFTYIDAETELPLVWHKPDSTIRYSLEDLTLQPLEPFTEQDGKLKANSIPLSRVDLHLTSGLCNHTNEAGRCFAATASFGNDFTDTIEVYHVISGYGECDQPYGQSLFYINRELVATTELREDAGHITIKR